MTDVTIYTKPGCPYCAAAKKSYDDQGISYTEVDVKSSAENAAKAQELAGGTKIVPVIVEASEVKLGFGGS